jgi:hypothetical protein
MSEEIVVERRGCPGREIGQDGRGRFVAQNRVEWLAIAMVPPLNGNRGLAIAGCVEMCCYYRLTPSRRSPNIEGSTKPGSSAEKVESAAWVIARLIMQTPTTDSMNERASNIER